MKPEKNAGGQRLLTFVLIAIVLILAVGFAVNGWQAPETPNDDENPPIDTDNNDNQQNGNGEDNPDNNTDNNEDFGDGEGSVLPNEPEPPVIEIPKYYNVITGLEIAESDVNKAPIGFVLNSSMPLYGISNADLTIEFPTEDGSTRLLTYTTNDALLWKVGSLAPSRSFISGMSVFFGGTVVAYGKDDIVEYGSWETDKAVDISKHSDCYYVENTRFVYTSREMIDEVIARNGLLNTATYKSAPYEFVEEGEITTGQTSANTVTLPFSVSQRTEFQYSQTSNQYLYFKDGKRKVDMLNGKNVAFTNLFILFADTTTYEKSAGTEMVIDTSSGGKGYYISGGTKTEITWSTTLEGKLQFNTLDGEILKINRGNSYIGYYKASQTTNVTFS